MLRKIFGNDISSLMFMVLPFTSSAICDKTVSRADSVTRFLFITNKKLCRLGFLTIISFRCTRALHAHHYHSTMRLLPCWSIFTLEELGCRDTCNSLYILSYCVALPSSLATSSLFMSSRLVTSFCELTLAKERYFVRLNLHMLTSVSW